MEIKIGNTELRIRLIKSYGDIKRILEQDDSVYVGLMDDYDDYPGEYWGFRYSPDKLYNDFVLQEVLRPEHLRQELIDLFSDVAEAISLISNEEEK